MHFRFIIIAYEPEEKTFRKCKFRKDQSGTSLPVLVTGNHQYTPRGANE